MQKKGITQVVEAAIKVIFRLLNLSFSRYPCECWGGGGYLEVWKGDQFCEDKGDVNANEQSCVESSNC